MSELMDRFWSVEPRRRSWQSLTFDIVFPCRVVPGFCVLLIAIACCLLLAVPAYADSGDDGASRSIAIVYDDSTSMNANTAWCQAHYAIEVFAAMLDENDELAVFTMSAADAGDSQPDLVISGEEPIQQRVAKAHGDFSRIDAWTNFGAADNAYAYLMSKPANEEKWLVILTDGAFLIADELRAGGPGANADANAVANRVRSHLVEWAAAGMNVEYVGLGEEAIAFDGSERFSAQVIAGDAILDGVIDESNKIFRRAQLPASSYSNGSLDIGIPMGKIVVFAQGEDVNVGALSIADESYEPVEVSQVHYVDKPNVGQTGDLAGTVAPIDASLQGVVATFETNDGFPSGGAELSVANADAVAIYYQPYVNVELTLSDKVTGEQIVLDGSGQSSLQPGTYQSDYKLLDPFTGNEIHSDLIRSTSFATQLSMGDAEPIAVPDGGDVSIPEGKAELVGVAVINDEVEVPQRYDVVILAKDLDVMVISKPEGPVDVRGLDEAAPIVVKVTKQGASLTEAEWRATDLAVGSPGVVQPEGFLGWLFGSTKGIGSEWIRGSEPGTYEIRLKTFNGEPADTLDGDVPITVKATYDPGYGQSYGELNTTEQIQGVGLLERILHWILTHLLQLGLLLFLLLLLAFIIMELRKPRLPKLKPRISGVKDNEDLQLVYAQKKKEHSIWPPWAPETNTLKVSVRGQAASVYRLNERFPLGEKTIGIVAAKTKRGKKGVRLSDVAIATLDKHKSDEFLGSNEKYINPSYSGERQIFTPGGGFNFQGKKPHKKKGWSKPEEATYRITF